MALTRTRATTGPDPTRRYRAWQSFAGPVGACKKGDVLRGDDPIVVASFPYFVDHELVSTHDEPNEFSMVAKRHDAEQAERETAHAAYPPRSYQMPTLSELVLRAARCRTAESPAWRRLQD